MATLCEAIQGYDGVERRERRRVRRLGEALAPKRGRRGPPFPPWQVQDTSGGRPTRLIGQYTHVTTTAWAEIPSRLLLLSCSLHT